MWESMTSEYQHYCNSIRPIMKLIIHGSEGMIDLESAYRKIVERRLSKVYITLGERYYRSCRYGISNVINMGRNDYRSLHNQPEGFAYPINLRLAPPDKTILTLADLIKDDESYSLSRIDPEKLELNKLFIPAEHVIEKHPIQPEPKLKKESDKWINKMNQVIKRELPWEEMMEELRPYQELLYRTKVEYLETVIKKSPPDARVLYWWQGDPKQEDETYSILLQPIRSDYVKLKKPKFIETAELLRIGLQVWAGVIEYFTEREISVEGIVMYSDNSSPTDIGPYLNMDEQFLTILLSTLEELFPISAIKEENICKLIMR